MSGGPSGSGASPANSRGVAVTASGTANTKGSWAEVLASNDYDTDWLVLGLNAIAVGAGGSRYYLVDIGVGPAGSENVLIANMHFNIYDDGSRVSSEGTWLFPLRLAAGARLAARSQSSPASSAIYVTANPIAHGIAAPGGYARCENVGADTASSRGVSLDAGAVANTDSAWTEMIAATAFPYRWMTLAGSYAPATVTRPYWLIDLAVGAIGSEVAFLNDLAFSGSYGMGVMGGLSIPVAIAAGQRISARARSNNTNATERVLSLVAQGVG